MRLQSCAPRHLWPLSNQGFLPRPWKIYAVLSRFCEKYSNTTWFPLFCFLLFAGFSPVAGQEVLWSHEGVGRSPNVNVLLGEGDPSLVLATSPFAVSILALNLSDGSVLWQVPTVDRISRPARMLTDVALLATHSGTLVALETDDGQERWRRTSEDPQDVSAITPMFIDGEIYTLTEKGALTRYSATGEVLARRKIDANWAGRRAEVVPMWRDNTGLSFLDQAGRLRDFDLKTLEMTEEKRITTAVGPGMGQLGSELLGGVFSVTQEQLWTTELSGLLRATNSKSGRSRWTAAVGRPEEMYSLDGRVLAVPILSRPPDQKALVVTREHARLFSAETGRASRAHLLPSPAVAPPIFDPNRQSWWILTENHLVALRWDGELRAVRLPILERPYAGALAGNALIVGTEDGRIYAMTIP